VTRANLTRDRYPHSLASPLPSHLESERGRGGERRLTAPAVLVADRLRLPHRIPSICTVATRNMSRIHAASEKEAFCGFSASPAAKCRRMPSPESETIGTCALRQKKLPRLTAWHSRRGTVDDHSLFSHSNPSRCCGIVRRFCGDSPTVCGTGTSRAPDRVANVSMHFWLEGFLRRIVVGVETKAIPSSGKRATG
jgi:hypothetical protein